MCYIRDEKRIEMSVEYFFLGHSINLVPKRVSKMFKVRKCAFQSKMAKKFHFWHQI